MKVFLLSSRIMHMTFGDYVKTTFPALALYPDMTQAKYVIYFCCLLLDKNYETEADSLPLRIRMADHNEQGKFFRGARNLCKTDALRIYQNWNPKRLIKRIMEANFESRYEMFASFEAQGILFRDDDDELKAEVIADNLKNLMLNISNGKKDTSTNYVEPGEFSVEEVNESCYYNQEKGLLIIGKRIVQIDPVVAPDEVDSSEDKQLYIRAMLQMFASLLGVEIDSISTLKEIDSYYYRELLRNREYFYCAESIRHIIRDAFSNGREHFESYMEEIYDGVIDVHRMKYADGYERMLAVLKQSTLMQPNSQKLERLYIIGTKEKKGICHMLIEEGKITSWIERF